MERTVNTLWLIRQPPIDTPEYSDSMMSTLEAVSEIREEARMALAKNKQTLEKAYNKRVRSRTFALGDLVWRAILPLGKKDPEIGKWSPNWEGPYVIHQSLGKNVYRLKDMHGVIVQRTWAVLESLYVSSMGQFRQRYTGANESYCVHPKTKQRVIPKVQ